jgi:hypothetical protein
VEGRGVAVCRVESGDRGDKMGSGDWGVRWVTLEGEVSCLGVAYLRLRGFGSGEGGFSVRLFAHEIGWGEAVHG